MNSIKRPIGIHFRLQKNLADIAHTALNLGADTAQFFLIPQEKGGYMRIHKNDLETFLQLKKSLGDLYIHSSYWINLASGRKESIDAAQETLKREIRIAKKIGVKHLVLHPGAANYHAKSDGDPTGAQAGITAFSTALNRVLKREHDICVLLENTAHRGRSIGSNFDDLRLIFERLENPDRVGFCLDVAHAFAFGYAMHDVDALIAKIDATINLSRLKLLHVHDSAEPFASGKDRHANPGEGLIGLQSLQNIVKHTALAHVPIILELPPVTLDVARSIIATVRSWK